MKSQIKKLGKYTAIYGIGDSLQRMLGFLLIPIYTRYLTPADYGQLELLFVILSLSSTVAAQGMRNAFFRHYTSSDDELERSELLSTAFYYLVFSSFVVFGMIYLFSEQLSEAILGKGDPLSVFVKLIAVTGFCQMVVLIPLDSIRAKLEPVKYIAISITGFLIQTGLNIYFVVVLRIGLMGVLLGYAMGAVSVAIVTISWIRKDLNFKISKGMLKDLLSFGLPLVPVGISFWILGVSDRLLLEKLASTHELGLYSLGGKFANILSIFVITPFSIAWGPYCFRIAKGDQAKETFKLITTYLLLVLCSAGVFLIVLTPPVIRIVAGKEFWDAHKVVLPLVYAGIAYGMFSIFDLGINIVKKTRHFSYIIGIGGITDIVLNLLLIPRYGMVGTGFAFFIAYLITMLITYHISQKFYYIPFEIGRMLKICSVFLIITIASALLEFSNPVADLAYRTFLILFFFVSFHLIRFFHKEEKEYAKMIYRDLKQRKGILSKLQFSYELIKTD